MNCCIQNNNNRKTTTGFPTNSINVLFYLGLTLDNECLRCYRSRLEGNTESWNSLLLSLRELIEWVIRKDTELTAMGPASGDLSSLSKLESDLLTFRRVLDEKQPVVESNLKSGRQLIASEPPLSDTSDSECKESYYYFSLRFDTFSLKYLISISYFLALFKWESNITFIQ